MKHIVLLVAFLSGCTDQSPAHTATSQAIEEQCGPRPLAPGLAVQVDKGIASMSVASYGAIVQYQLDASAYLDCSGDVLREVAP